jgi:flavin-binding protein dodecin
MEPYMADHVYKYIELVGSSKSSLEEAIQNAVNKAAQSVRNMRWFVVTEQRGYIEDNAVAYYQVTIKVGFTLDD